MESHADGRITLLDYLILTAVETQGAGVWRALFAEIRKDIVEQGGRLPDAAGKS